MSKWVDRAEHPIKRKLRWVCLAVGWVIVGALVALVIALAVKYPRFALAGIGIVAYMSLIDLIVWVFTDDKKDDDDDGRKQAPETS